jgi:hypothetical protein
LVVKSPTYKFRVFFPDGNVIITTHADSSHAIVGGCNYVFWLWQGGLNIANMYVTRKLISTKHIFAMRQADCVITQRYLLPEDCAYMYVLKNMANDANLSALSPSFKLCTCLLQKDKMRTSSTLLGVLGIHGMESRGASLPSEFASSSQDAIA